MRLTRNFSLEELLHSSYADAHGIDNTPSNLDEITANLRALCENVLQGIRDGLGKPVTVSSGYRSVALNAAVGGRPKSQHAEGKAADIEIAGMTTQEVFDWVRGSPLQFDQLIIEHRANTEWVHVSYDVDKAAQRLQCLRSPDGVTFEVV